MFRIVAAAILAIAASGACAAEYEWPQSEINRLLFLCRHGQYTLADVSIPERYLDTFCRCQVSSFVSGISAYAMVMAIRDVQAHADDPRHINGMTKVLMALQVRLANQCARQIVP